MFGADANALIEYAMVRVAFARDHLEPELWRGVTDYDFIFGHSLSQLTGGHDDKECPFLRISACMCALAMASGSKDPRMPMLVDIYRTLLQIRCLEVANPSLATKRVTEKRNLDMCFASDRAPSAFML